jgi:hypothetical protein
MRRSHYAHAKAITIGKVMFLTVVARPRFDSQGNELFFGKIGVFPFVTYEAAKRNSVNRPAGTLEMKPITSVNKEVSKRFLIEKNVPAIKAKWPRESLHDAINVQQDTRELILSMMMLTFAKLLWKMDLKFV